jgi:dsDNA-specific endonuclease/ATPase MutS2
MKDGQTLTYGDLRREVAAALDDAEVTQRTVAAALGVTPQAISNAKAEAGPRRAKLQRRILAHLTHFRVEERVTFVAHLDRAGRACRKALDLLRFLAAARGDLRDALASDVPDEAVTHVRSMVVTVHAAALAVTHVKEPRAEARPVPADVAREVRERLDDVQQQLDHGGMDADALASAAREVEDAADELRAAVA